jgi:hypothetical protein
LGRQYKHCRPKVFLVGGAEAGNIVGCEPPNPLDAMFGSPAALFGQHQAKYFLLANMCVWPLQRGKLRKWRGIISAFRDF